MDKRCRYFIVLLFAGLAGYALGDLVITEGFIVSTDGGVRVKIDDALQEINDGYLRGEISSGHRIGLSDFAGMHLSEAFDGSVVRHTGAEYAKEHGEGTNFLRYYEVNNTGGAVPSVNLLVGFTDLPPHDERNGLTVPYYVYRYTDSWTDYLVEGIQVSPYTALGISHAEIPAGLSDWVISDGDFITYLYTYHFPTEGWYMISLPVLPPDSTAASLFEHAVGAYTWDPVAEQYVSADEIWPHLGYWLAVDAPGDDDVEGHALWSYDVHFNDEGWYMIGAVRGSVDFSNPADAPDGAVFSPAFGWDHDANAYVESATLDEQFGYWAAVFGEADLTVGGPGGGGGAPSTGKASLGKTHGSMPPGPPRIDWETGEIVLVPTAFFLDQNFPNPFNPSTTIQYGLPEDGHLTLVVYNMLGQRVRTLVDEPMRAGSYEIVWDAKDEAGSDVTGGVYFIRMHADDFSRCKKLVYVR